MMRNLNRWLIIAIIIIIASGMVLTLWTVQREENLLRSDLLIKTRLMQGGISTDQIKTLTGTEKDLVSPDYQNLKEHIRTIESADPLIRFIYIMGQRPDGTVFFFIDSEPATSEYYSYPGQSYEEASALVLNVFASGEEVTEGPLSDRWGTWVSGFVPIRDSTTGRVIAVLGTDIDAWDWNIQMISASAPAVIAMLLLLLLLLIFFYVQQRNAREREILSASEAALKEGETRYRTVFESTGTAMLIIEEDTTIAFANKEFFRLTGYSQEDIDSRRSWTEFVCREDLERMLDQHWIRRQTPENALNQYEFRLIKKSGEISNILLNINLFPGTKRSIASLIDITYRKEAEQALRKSEELFRTIFEKGPLGMVMSDEKFRFLKINPMFCSMLGYSQEELLQKKFTDITHPDHTAEDISRIQRLSAGEISEYKTEKRYIKKNGDIFWALVIVSLVKDSEGKFLYYLVFITDITERKHVEAEIEYHSSVVKQYADTVNQINDKLNLLNTITRHDILNQLTIILGYLEMMKVKFPDPALHKFIDLEIQSAKNIQTQIVFTKDYQEIGVQSPRWFNLREIIVSNASNLPLSTVNLEVRFDNLEIFADPLLGKVFYTLIENALRHGKTVTGIEFSCRTENEDLVVIYQDNGVGIPAEYKEAILQRKFFKHTGFGLYLSRTILAITGMKIRENGEPGKGARFEILVPKGVYRFTPAEEYIDPR